MKGSAGRPGKLAPIVDGLGVVNADKQADAIQPPTVNFFRGADRRRSRRCSRACEVSTRRSTASSAKR